MVNVFHLTSSEASTINSKNADQVSFKNLTNFKLQRKKDSPRFYI